MAQTLRAPGANRETKVRPSFCRGILQKQVRCCPRRGNHNSCGEKNKPKIIDSIIAHLKLTFEAERPPPPHIAHQELLMAAEKRGEYF